MKKNYNPIKPVGGIPLCRNRWKNLIRPLFAALTILLISPSHGFAQQGGRMTVNQSGVPLASVLKTLEDNHGYTFAYRTDDVAAVGSVTVRVNNGTIQNVMDAALQGTGLSYTVQGTRVTITRAQQNAQTDGTLFNLRGKVVDAATGQPISNAAIQIIGQPHGGYANHQRPRG